MAFGGVLDLRFRVTADSKQAAKQIDDLKSSIGRSTAAISASINRSFRGATKDSEGLFTALDQARIGLEQLSRGSLGSLPNFAKAFRALRADTSDIGSSFKVLDAALSLVGAKATTAKDLFEEFRDRVKTGSSGIDAESKAIRAAFSALGIDMTEALLRPEKAFGTVLKLIGQFGPETERGKAALDALGVGLGDVSKAATVAGQSLITLGAGASGLAVAAGIAGAAIAAAVVLAVGAIVAAAAATKGMIETAKEVGTKSKEDFDKFKKSVEAAGFSVTNLDRALGQGITKSIDRIKGGFDGLFIDLIRTSGPQLITVLRSIGDILRDLSPLAKITGTVLANAFLAATAAIDLFRITVKAAFTDYVAFAALLASPENLLRGLAFAFDVAQAKARAFKDGLKLDPFEGTDKSAKDATNSRLRELDIQLKAAQRVYAEETAAAKEAFEERRIGNERLIERLIAAEEELLAVRRRVFAEERELVAESAQGDQDKATKLAELREKELQAESDFNAKLRAIRKEGIEQDKEDGDERLKRAQERFLAVADLNRKIAALQLESRALQLEIDRTNLDLRVTTPLNRAENLRREAELQLEAEDIRSQAALQEIDNRRFEAQLLAETLDELLAIDARFDALRKKELERARRTDELIQENLRREQEREDPLSGRSLFGDDFADAIDQGATKIQALAASFGESFRQMSASAGNFKTTFVQAVQLATGALQNMLATWIQTGKTGPAAARQLVAGVLSALSQLWLAKAIAELAEGFAALFFNPAEAAAHFKSSGLYFAAMAAAGVAGRAVAGDAFQQAAGGGGGGSSPISEPPQVNLNRGGEGERLGVGEAGADLVAGGLFGQAVVAIQRVGESVSRLEQKIVEMTPGNVVAVGAPLATNEIGQAVVSEARQSAEFTNSFGRVLFGPA